jgi:hypothetical protein
VLALRVMRVSEVQILLAPANRLITRVRRQG